MSNSERQPGTTRRRLLGQGPFGFLVRLVIFALIFLGVAEVWFRTVTPASEIPLYAQQNDQFKIRRFDPQGLKQGDWTLGRLALAGGNWRINNDGWNSTVDYAPPGTRQGSLVALVGDSFIEGFLTDVDEHVDVYLSHLLGSQSNVYAFGVSGWYLEQLVAVSRYVSSAYVPDLLVVFVDEGDVVDSVRKDQTFPAWLWQIGYVDGRFAELPPTEIYTASRFARLSRSSALVRYLRYNAKVALPGMANAVIARDRGTVNPGSGQGGAASDATGAWEELVPAANFMIDRLRGALPGVPIIVAVHDDPVNYVSAGAVKDQPLFVDARAVQAALENRPDFYFLDLRYAFSADWEANHRTFEAADGDHWNNYGNEVVARTLASLIEENGLLKKPGQTAQVK
jgi:hypothetical protein